MDQNTHNEDVADMKLKHPYRRSQEYLERTGRLPALLSHRTVISDNKLSFMFNESDVTSDTEGWGIEDGYIYFKPLFSGPLGSEWYELHSEDDENTLITVWIFKERTPDRNGIESYTKIKGYRKCKTCSCFMAIKIESQEELDVPFEI